MSQNNIVSWFQLSVTRPFYSSRFCCGVRFSLRSNSRAVWSLNLWLMINNDGSVVVDESEVIARTEIKSIISSC